MAIGIGGLLGIDAAANLLGGLFNTGISTYAQKSLMKYQSELQQQMVDRANEYNLPKNQVQRLLDGHLNPNLAYSSVNSVAGSSTPSVGLNSAASPNVRLELLGQMRQYQQYQTDKAVTRLQNANAEHQELENEELRAKQPYFQEMAQIERMTASFVQDYQQYHKSVEYYKQENSRRLYDILQDLYNDDTLKNAMIQMYRSYGYKNDKINADINQINQAIKESQQRVELMKKQGKNVDMRTTLLEMEKQLKDNGITWKDNVIYRFFAVVAKKLFGVSLGFGDEDSDTDAMWKGFD